jgi:hypothetical protein
LPDHRVLLSSLLVLCGRSRLLGEVQEVVDVTRVGSRCLGLHRLAWKGVLSGPGELKFVHHQFGHGGLELGEVRSNLWKQFEIVFLLTLLGHLGLPKFLPCLLLRLLQSLAL